MEQTRIKATFGYKKRFHSSAFVQDILSTLKGQLIKETMDRRNSLLAAILVSLIQVGQNYSN